MDGFLKTFPYSSEMISSPPMHLSSKTPTSPIISPTQHTTSPTRYIPALSTPHSSPEAQPPTSTSPPTSSKSSLTYHHISGSTSDFMRSSLTIGSIIPWPYRSTKTRIIPLTTSPMPPWSGPPHSTTLSTPSHSTPRLSQPMPTDFTQIYTLNYK